MEFYCFVDDDRTQEQVEENYSLDIVLEGDTQIGLYGCEQKLELLKPFPFNYPVGRFNPY